MVFFSLANDTIKAASCLYTQMSSDPKTTQLLVSHSVKRKHALIFMKRLIIPLAKFSDPKSARKQPHGCMLKREIT